MNIQRHALMLAGVLLLAGCTLGPDYVRPSASVPASYKEGFAWQTARPSDHLGRGNWWS